MKSAVTCRNKSQHPDVTLRERRKSMTQARTRSTGTEVDERTGRRVARFRVQRGWSYRQLSLAVHDMTRDDPGGPQEITPGVLRNIEDGIPMGNGVRQVRRVTVGEASLLARVFGMTVSELIGEGESGQ